MVRTRHGSAALLHESSLARTMPPDRILTCRCDMTLDSAEFSNTTFSHIRRSADESLRTPHANGHLHGWFNQCPTASGIGDPSRAPHVAVHENP